MIGDGYFFVRGLFTPAISPIRRGILTFYIVKNRRIGVCNDLEYSVRRRLRCEAITLKLLLHVLNKSVHEHLLVA